MENQTLEKVFSRLDECSIAADKLSKSFKKFNTVSEKLEGNISKVIEFDKSLKEDDAFQTLLGTTEDIKEMTDYFRNKLPELSQCVLDSKKGLLENKDVISQAGEEIFTFKEELSEITAIADYLKDIHSRINDLTSLNIYKDIEQFKEIIEEYNLFQKDIETLLNQNNEYFKKQFQEFRGIREEIKKDVELVSEFREELKNINVSIQSLKDEILQRETGFSVEIKTMDQTILENSKLLSSLINETPIIIQSNQEVLNQEVKVYIEELLKTQISEIKKELKHLEGHVILKEIEENKPEIMKHSKPTTIEALYRKNKEKLPLKVQKSSWTSKYYFLIEEIQEIENKLNAVGKTYVGEKIRKKKEIRPVIEDGFIIYRG